MMMMDTVKWNNHGLVGCSLYTPKVNEIGPAPNAWSPPPWNPFEVLGPKLSQHRLFYFQLPCSWGAVYHSRSWNQFRKYYDKRVKGEFTDNHNHSNNDRERERKGIFQEELTIPNSRSNEWFQSWKRVFIEWMLLKGGYMLYPLHSHYHSYSTNHFEVGIHSVAEPTNEPFVPNKLRGYADKRFTIPLIMAERPIELPRIDRELLDKIGWINLRHKKVNNRDDLYENSFLTREQHQRLMSA